MSELERCGSEALKNIIEESRNKGQPFTCIVYSILLPWVATVARSLDIPSVLLWIQPAVVFALYYYYNNGYYDEIQRIISSDDPNSMSIKLPGLPLLSARDLPSFFGSSDVYDFALPIFRRQFELLEEESNPKVLINTFEELEKDAVRAIKKFHLMPIGPLIPSAFLDGHDPSEVSSGCDLFRSTSSYIDWLNSKPKASVIYVSSGSISTLSKQQKEEIARGLLSTKRPFLWVIRDIEEEKEDALSFKEKLETQGKIVSWCSQLEVLSSPATGCFLTHCGWNSCLESLACGIPTVTLPQWTDQATNAKIVQDLSETGVRLKVAEDGVVKGEEIERCLELVMGNSEKGEEIRRNAMKWKKLAREAASEGGSSCANLKAFVDQVCS